MLSFFEKQKTVETHNNGRLGNCIGTCGNNDRNFQPVKVDIINILDIVQDCELNSDVYLAWYYFKVSYLTILCTPFQLIKKLTDNGFGYEIDLIVIIAHLGGPY